MDTLLEKVEAGDGLTPEERLEIGTLQAQRKSLGLAQGTELEKPLPWLYMAQHVLFGWWEDVEDEEIHHHLWLCRATPGGGGPTGWWGKQWEFRRLPLTAG